MTKLSFNWLLLAILASQTQVFAQENLAPVEKRPSVETQGATETQATRESQALKKQDDSVKPIPLMASPSKVSVRGPQPLKPNRKKIELECGLPPAVPLQHQEEVKTTPEEELLPWRADCLRRIRRRLNKHAKHTVCKVKLKEDGTVDWIKVEKFTDKSGGVNAVVVIESALPFQKAPNELPYTGTLKIEFLDYPNIKLSIEK